MQCVKAISETRRRVASDQMVWCLRTFSADGRLDRDDQCDFTEVRHAAGCYREVQPACARPFDTKIDPESPRCDKTMFNRIAYRGGMRKATWLVVLLVSSIRYGNHQTPRTKIFTNRDPAASTPIDSIREPAARSCSQSCPLGRATTVHVMLSIEAVDCYSHCGD